MTTHRAANVLNLALDGTFDDCQDRVKDMFNDTAFRQDMQLGAINSINFARLAAQAAYYVYARHPSGRSRPTRELCRADR